MPEQSGKLELELAFKEGYDSFFERVSNPYGVGSDLWLSWLQGFNYAKNELSSWDQ